MLDVYKRQYEGFAVGPHVVTDNATGFYVSADAPYSTYPELIDYCKEHPGDCLLYTSHPHQHPRHLLLHRHLLRWLPHGQKG